MKKVQALPVFLSFLLVSSVALTPTKVSAFNLKEFYNPFHSIKEYIEKEKMTEIVTLAENQQTDPLRWKVLPLHTEYHVKVEDTLQSIAQFYRISKADIEQSNAWVKEPLEAGQIIYIPLAANRVHHVSWGDTIYTLADQYGVSTSELIMNNFNIDSNSLLINQEIMIPKQSKQRTVQVAATTASFNNPMVWPVLGVLTSAFGPRWGSFHQGIDIWHQQELQTPIYASLPGTVTFADWSGSGYGRLVIVDHSNGIQTYYAHLNRIQVAEGQKVRQGDILGRMGDTGNTIGVHLHFELRVEEQPVNPMRYLPNLEQQRVLQ